MTKRKWNPWKYIKNYKFNSLFLKNFILILCLILVPIWGFCIAIYFYFQTSFKSEIENTTQNNLERIKEIVDTTQINMQTLCTNLASDSFITDYMKTEYHSRITYDESKSLQQLIKNVKLMSNEYVESIYLYSEHSEYVVSMEGAVKSDIFYDMSWMEEMKEHTKYGGVYIWGRVREEKSFLKNNQRKTVPCITTGISVPVVPANGADGYIIMNMDNSWIDRLVSGSSSNYQDFFILGKDGKIIYNRDTAMIGKRLGGEYKEGNQYVRKMADSAVTGWQYVYVIDITGLQQRVEGLLQIIIFVVGVSSIVAIVLAYVISMRVFLPVRNIIEMIDNPLEFYDMNAKTQEKKGSYNEVKYITAAFMKNIKENTQNRETLTEYITKLKQTQISLLQMQINPHFLFNIFQSISFMSVRLTKSDNEVSRAIEKLSYMLRSMVDVERNLISVKKELAYSKAYIELEQLRYKNAFLVYWNISSEIFDYLTVKMFLQPLLENCIRHGFKGKEIEQKITVEGMVKQDRVCFEITDNGVGMEKEEVDRWNQELEEFHLIEGEHIGIRNVNQRIKMMFGNDYGIHIFHMSRGLKVEVSLPIIQEETGK